MMSDIVTKVIEGKVMWAVVHKPMNKYKSEDLEYRITVEVDMEMIDSIKALGSKKEYKVLKDEAGNPLPGRYMQFARDADVGVAPLAVIDEAGNPFKENIGNGSVCRVAVAFIPFKSAKYGNGVKAKLTGVRVLEHKEYKASGKQDKKADADALEALLGPAPATKNESSDEEVI